MYLLPFIHGIWQGFIISILLFGPAFFKLINTSIQHGFKHGLMLAWGVFLSDLLVVILCLFGFANIMEYPIFQKFYSLLAAVLLFLLGIKAFKHQYRTFAKSYASRVPENKNMLKGFALNLINPFTFILWLNVQGTVSLKYAGSKDYIWLVSINLFSILLVIFLMDILKVYLSHLLGKRLNIRLFFYINKYFGVLLMAIAFFFFYHYMCLMKWI